MDVNPFGMYYQNYCSHFTITVKQELYYMPNTLQKSTKLSAMLGEGEKNEKFHTNIFNSANK